LDQFVNKTTKNKIKFLRKEEVVGIQEDLKRDSRRAEKM
jgi:hypothetical protein